MKRVGFTGSRLGMFAEQIEALKLLLAGMVPIEAHHGCCEGADAQFHGIVLEMRAKHNVAASSRLIGHPPTCKGMMATLESYAEMRPDKDFLVRNLDIVTEVELLIAAPAGTEGMEPRSGTWATVRMARRAGRDHVIIRPNGHLEHVAATQRPLF